MEPEFNIDIIIEQLRNGAFSPDQLAEMNNWPADIKAELILQGIIENKPKSITPISDDFINKTLDNLLSKD